MPVDPPFVIAGSTARRVISFFEPTAFLEAAVTMSFWGGTTELGQATMTGVGGDPFAKAHTLHPVVSGDTVFTEPESLGGSEVCTARLQRGCADCSDAHLQAP